MSYKLSNKVYLVLEYLIGCLVLYSFFHFFLYLI